MESRTFSSSLLAQARAHVYTGNETELRLLFNALSREERIQLILARSGESLCVKRPSSASKVVIHNCNLLTESIASWFNGVTDYLSSYGVGIDEDIQVTDHSNDPVNYVTKPLVLASMLNKVDMAGSLITNGSDVNGCNSLGDTGLLEACFEGNYAVTEFLVTKGASINKQNERGITGQYSLSQCECAQCVWTGVVRAQLAH